MITIFGDFCQFSAKNLTFFSKINVMITFLGKKTSCSLSKKRQYFRQIFGENNIKIMTSVPAAAVRDFVTTLIKGRFLKFHPHPP
jgi:hypothetical protein